MVAKITEIFKWQIQNKDGSPKSHEAEIQDILDQDNSHYASEHEKIINSHYDTLHSHHNGFALDLAGGPCAKRFKASSESRHKRGVSECKITPEKLNELAADYPDRENIDIDIDNVKLDSNKLISELKSVQDPVLEKQWLELLKYKIDADSYSIVGSHKNSLMQMIEHHSAKNPVNYISYKLPSCRSIMPTTCIDKYNMGLTHYIRPEHTIDRIDLAASLGIDRATYADIIAKSNFQVRKAQDSHGPGSKSHTGANPANNILQAINLALILKGDLDQANHTLALAEDAAIISAPILSIPVAHAAENIYGKYVASFLVQSAEKLGHVTLARVSQSSMISLAKIFNAEMQNTIRALPGTVGPGLSIALSSYDLYKAIKDYKNATDKYDKTSSIIRMTTDVAMISMGTGELAALAFGAELGIVGALGVLVIIVASHAAQTGVALAKLKSEIDLRGLEALHEYGHLLIGEAISEYLQDDIEAKNIYKSLIADRLQQVSSLDFGAVVTQLEDIIQFREAKLDGRHTTYSIDEHRILPDRCKISCNTVYNTISRDLITPEQPVVNLTSSLKDQLSFTPIASVSRVLKGGDYIHSTTLACAPTIQDVTRVEIERYNISVLPENHGRYISYIIDHHVYCDAYIPTCTDNTTIFTVKDQLSLNAEIPATSNNIYNYCEHAVALVNNTVLQDVESNNATLRVLYNIQGTNGSTIITGNDDNVIVLHANSIVIAGNNTNTLLLAAPFDSITFSADSLATNTLLLSGYDYAEDDALRIGCIHNIIGQANTVHIIYADNSTRYINSKGSSAIHTKHSQVSQLIIDANPGDEIFIRNNESVTHIINILNDTQQQDVYRYNDPIQIRLPLESNNSSIILNFNYDIQQLANATYNDRYEWLKLDLMDDNTQQSKTVYLYDYKQVAPVCLLQFRDNTTVSFNIPNYGDDKSHPIQEIAIIQKLSGNLTISEQEAIMRYASSKFLTNFTSYLQIVSDNFYAIIDEQKNVYNTAATIADDKTTFMSLKDKSDTYYIKHCCNIIINNQDNYNRTEDDIIDLTPLWEGLSSKELLFIRNLRYQNDDLIMEYGVRADDAFSALTSWLMNYPTITLKYYKKGDKFQHLKLRLDDSGTLYSLHPADNGHMKWVSDDGIKIKPIFLSEGVSNISIEELQSFGAIALIQAEAEHDIAFIKRKDDLVLFIKNLSKALVIKDYYSQQYSDNHLELHLLNETITASKLQNLTSRAISVDEYLDLAKAQLANSATFVTPTHPHTDIFLDGIEDIIFIKLENIPVSSASIADHDGIELVINRTDTKHTIKLHNLESNKAAHLAFIFRDGTLPLPAHSTNQTGVMRETLSSLQNHKEHPHRPHHRHKRESEKFGDKIAEVSNKQGSQNEQLGTENSNAHGVYDPSPLLQTAIEDVAYDYGI